MRFFILFFWISTICFAKNPAFILYDDGTWEKAGGSSFDLSSVSASNSSTGTLEVHAALKMQRGGAKPVSNEDVFLSTKSAKQMILEYGYSKPLKDHETYIGQYSWFCTYPSSDDLRGIGIAAKTGIEKYTVSEEITDLEGKAEFLGIQPGKYYVILRTSLGAAWGSAWSVPVEVKAGRNKIILRNENVNEDLLHEGVSLNSSSSKSPRTSPTRPLTYEEERQAVLKKHEAGLLSTEEAVKQLKSLKAKYNK